VSTTPRVCEDKDDDSKIRTGDEGTIRRTRRRQQAKEGGNVADAKGREHGNTDPYVLRIPGHTNPTFSYVTFAPHLRRRRTRTLPPWRQLAQPHFTQGAGPPHNQPTIPSPPPYTFLRPVEILFSALPTLLRRFGPDHNPFSVPSLQSQKI
jgi:hypothetical protein